MQRLGFVNAIKAAHSANEHDKVKDLLDQFFLEEKDKSSIVICLEELMNRSCWGLDDVYDRLVEIVEERDLFFDCMEAARLDREKRE